MLAMIRHRGPDQFGIYLDGQAALGSARLSIVDLGNGQQPIPNEDETLWIVFNGEIFNHPDLRSDLEARGHRFRTACDTEVVLHAFEEFGPDCLRRFNGQFVIAIWDSRNRRLFLARDRLGVRPLFYALHRGGLAFASEIKALLACPGLSAELDPTALDQVFTYWSTLGPRTCFKDILDFPPGHFMLADEGGITLDAYWRMDFPQEPPCPMRGIGEAAEAFRELLVDATRIRLRADVPVGAYLSGGLDSSTIAAVIRNHTSNRLDTFSIAFGDPGFDESDHQLRMARHLGTDHQVVRAEHADIGRVFPEVVWHAETPLLRTSPAPMFLLSDLVRRSGYKVVLTGEGADEFLAGYDIFKEARLRRFWAARPDSAFRPSLFGRIYPWVEGLTRGRGGYASAFFGLGLGEVDDPAYSHRLRWRTTARTKRFFSADLARSLGFGPGPALAPGFGGWDPLHQAQYLEISIFLSQYLLSSQGDRMAMGHSVEGRFPFLDHRLVEFCNRLPPSLKLRGLTEKFLLREVSRPWLPPEIHQRPKQPFRAPIHRAFFPGKPHDYLDEILSPRALAECGVFDPAKVEHLVAKVRGGLPLGETDDMALAGIVSTQLVHRQFVARFRTSPPLDDRDDVKVVAAPALQSGS
jgi:asparagine synthase (glutamine-hydrolysing)